MCFERRAGVAVFNRMLHQKPAGSIEVSIFTFHSKAKGPDASNRESSRKTHRTKNSPESPGPKGGNSLREFEGPGSCEVPFFSQQLRLLGVFRVGAKKRSRNLDRARQATTLLKPDRTKFPFTRPCTKTLIQNLKQP